MVADLLGSLSFEVTNEHGFADAHSAQGDDFADGAAFEEGEAAPFFVRGSVLDACVASDRVERTIRSGHIAAIDSDDNGLYRLFRCR